MAYNGKRHAEEIYGQPGVPNSNGIDRYPYAEYANNYAGAMPPVSSNSLMGSTPASHNGTTGATALIGDCPQPSATYQPSTSGDVMTIEQHHHYMSSPYGAMHSYAAQSTPMPPSHYNFSQQQQQQQQQRQHLQMQQPFQQYQSMVSASMAMSQCLPPPEQGVYQMYPGDHMADYAGANVHAAIVRPNMKRRKSGLPPSKVVHLREVARFTLEKDLFNAFSLYGKINYISMIPSSFQALIEFEDVSSAIHLMEVYPGRELPVCGKITKFNYSNSDKINRNETENGDQRILLFTVVNPQYPITVHVIHTICSEHGNVLRIVVFKKTGLQVLVEFATPEGASKAKHELNGADIYSNCCTLKIEYAKTDKINVIRNNDDSWDYTTTEKQFAIEKSMPLLESPRYAKPANEFGNEEFRQESYSRGAGGVYDTSDTSSFGSMPNEQHTRIVGDGGFRERAAGFQDTGFQRTGASGDFVGNRGRGVVRGGRGVVRGSMRSQYEDFRGPPSRFEEYPTRGDSRNFDNAPRRGNFNSQFGERRNAGGFNARASVDGNGEVYMLYQLVNFNCKKLFNLLCLFGNVFKIKMLKSKEGTAMVQMALGDRLYLVNGIECNGQKICMKLSNNQEMKPVNNPIPLDDGSPSYISFAEDKNNRFLTPVAASKNRMEACSKTLYYFNGIPKMDEQFMAKICEDAGAEKFMKFTKFPTTKEGALTTGLIEYDTPEQATSALILINHTIIDNPADDCGEGKFPYTLKLCYSEKKITVPRNANSECNAENN